MHRILARHWTGLAALVAVMAAAGLAPAGARQPETGVITFHLGEGRVYRVAADGGSTPEDVSARLNAFSDERPDDWLNVAPNGAWYLLETERFDPACEGWSCLALLPADLSSAEVLLADGQPLRTQGFGAVGSSGDVVIFPADDGPHQRDLWLTRRQPAGGWSVPVVLTTDSPYQWNDLPAISGDGLAVVFDCGDEPYGAAGTAICHAALDGTGLRVLIAPDQTPAGHTPGSALHHPDFVPAVPGDANLAAIVFEADWDGGEAIWWLDLAGGDPFPVGAFNNDNSPCVLPDGRIVSLWLDRRGGAGYHEIKAMTPDVSAPGGATYAMILTGRDVVDSGLGCGGGALDMAMNPANADVLYVRAERTGEEMWQFSVTVAHPDTGWEDYADGWDLVLPDGTIVKTNPADPFTRLLTHPHETEQPFTRSQGGLVIPPEVTQVRVRAHDLVDGWGGREVVVDLTVSAGEDFEVVR